MVSMLAVLGCAWGANRFEHWWILLFATMPLLLYYSAGIVVIGEDKEEDEVKIDS